MFTRTKIVCTIGPAVAEYEKILQLLQAGMNVARLNFSHGTYAEHERSIQYLKKARQELQKPLALMLDMKGPKIRIGKVRGDELALQPKERIYIGKEGQGPEVISIHPSEILAALRPGVKVLFDDGYIIGNVVEATPLQALIEIQNEGILKSNKGVNLPGTHVPLPAMTPEDLEDLAFGCKHDIDLVAASYIRSAHHVLSVKEFLRQQGKPKIPVIAKIESSQGVEHFDSIVQVADGIMIARGDLGVEMDLAIVPKLQKMMIRKCFQARKPSITATQMLESMISNPRPTRAEVSDVANAIYDSTSAIMLSAETAVGKYPVEVVQQMKRIAKEAEADFDYHLFFEHHSSRDYHDISSAVALAAVKTAYSANAKAIFAFTTSGTTALLLSRLRPEMPVIAVTPDEKNYHLLGAMWGVFPVLCPGCLGTKEAFAAASEFAMRSSLISFGDVVVVTSGVPFGKKGTTNTMIIAHIGDILVRGYPGAGPKVSGKVSFLLSAEGKETAHFAGQLVVLTYCDPSSLSALQGAAGIIVQNHIGDHASEKHAAAIARTLDIPYITRADGAMTVLEEGEEITLDPKKGLIYRGSEESTRPSQLFL